MKIERTNKSISDAEIEKRKDFDKVVTDIKPSKGGGKMKNIIAAGTVVVTVMMALFYMSDDKQVIRTNMAYITNYSNELGIDNTETYTVNISENTPTQVTTNAGSKIDIPSNALVDKYNEPITGEIEIRYKEILDQKDVFLSGIPMTYDSAGTTYNFESAGMISMLAYQNDEPIYVAENKEVNVSFQSKQPGNHFNQYQLDPETGKWTYKGKDEAGKPMAEVIASKTPASTTNVEEQALAASPKVTEIRKEIKALEVKQKGLKKPIKPKKATDKVQRFGIDVDQKEFPELDAFKKVSFQLSPKEKNYKDKYADAAWNDVKIDQVKNQLFNVCFTGKQYGTLCFLVEPVVEDEHFDGSMAAYKGLIKTYQKIRAQTQAAIKAKREALKIERERILAEEEVRRAKNREINRQIANTNNSVMRNFQMSGFGIWNSDHPRVLPNPIATMPTFVDASGNIIDIHRFSMSELEANYVVQGSGVIKFDPKKTNMIWAVVSEGTKVALVTNKELQKVKRGDHSADLKTTLIDAKTFAQTEVEELFRL